MRHDPTLARAEAVHLHREAHRRVQRADALPLQGPHDLAGDLVDVITAVVELQVGDGAGGAADRLPVHPADEAEKCPGRRKSTENIVPLVAQGRAGDLDQAGVVGTAVEAQLAQPGGIEGTGRLGGFGATGLAVVEAPHGRVFSQVHDGLICCICKYRPKKTRAGQRSACDRPTFRAAWSSRAIPLSPSSSVACRWASSQAGTAFSISPCPSVVSRKGWARRVTAKPGCDDVTSAAAELGKEGRRGRRMVREAVQDERRLTIGITTLQRVKGAV